MKYKWLTFIKNNSHFIVAYNNIKIHTSNQFTIYHNKGDELILLDNYTVKTRRAPLIASYLLKGEYPENIIEINNGALYLAATHIEKYLYANRDIVYGKIESFKRPGLNRYSPGRVRLFGNNYILISSNNTDFI